MTGITFSATGQAGFRAIAVRGGKLHRLRIRTSGEPTAACGVRLNPNRLVESIINGRPPADSCWRCFPEVAP